MDFWPLACSLEDAHKDKTNILAITPDKATVMEVAKDVATKRLMPLKAFLIMENCTTENDLPKLWGVCTDFLAMQSNKENSKLDSQLLVEDLLDGLSDDDTLPPAPEPVLSPEPAPAPGPAAAAKNDAAQKAPDPAAAAKPDAAGKKDDAPLDAAALPAPAQDQSMLPGQPPVSSTAAAMLAAANAPPKPAAPVIAIKTSDGLVVESLVEEESRAPSVHMRSQWRAQNI